ncbi:hydrolase [Capsulimonas corticalis]|uniref:alpha-L-rhamnosidase n=1 Tax=Capsulimonas corticalis TaxID=2219043 RepID=A0A402CSP9_9BACT|nr:family 78 glycoside hydrolase catalytic domain [Capsulimonas corticalis]BDI31001.1 hydrolase [Capsulimonas corticalis]
MIDIPNGFHAVRRRASRIAGALFLVLGASCAGLSVAGAACASPPISPVTFRRMTCEYLDSPQGIDIAAPRLSWREVSNTKEFTQQSYRILVSSSPAFLAAGKGDVWDSGVTRSPETNLIPVRGRALASRERCWWKVQVWDRQGRRSAWSQAATFTMGLLSPRDWRADWIGLRATGQDSETQAFLSQARWIWYPESGQPREAAPIGRRDFRIPVRIPDGRTVTRAIFIGTADNQFVLSVNGREAGRGDNWRQPRTIDATRFLHPGLNMLSVQASNIGENGPNPAGFIGALKIQYQDGGAPTVISTNAQWMSSQTANAGNAAPSDTGDWRPAVELGANGVQPWGVVSREDLSGDRPPLAARYLRREFDAKARIVRATAYLCGLGFFQCFVNGKPATDHVMDPALSDYEKAAYYVTADVTPLVRSGKNAIGVMLGNGRFFAPRLTSVGSTKDYGVPRLRMQLEIVYADGSRQTVASGPGWSASDQGPIRTNNEYDGETYDARMAFRDWTLPGFSPQDGRWAKAEVLPAPGGQLRSQMIEPMRVTETLRPIRVTSPQPGVYLVDMGRTFYGTVRLRARAARGVTVRMTSGYELLPSGLIKTADNRSAKATDVYTFAGNGVETWSPVFKGQGYRRIQVTGFPGKLSVNNFEGLIEHTDVRPVGSFSCSNVLINKVHDAMREGMRMFLRSAPLDPDRDERQSWMGDPAKDSESEAYNFDVAAFYTKWMDDVRRSQRPDGTIPDVSMYWEFGSGVEWPSVFTIIPDWYAGFYADTRLEQRNYEAMKRWVIAMKKLHGRPDGTLEGAGYGDWCDTYSMDGKGPDSGSTPHDLVSSAYQYHNVRILQQAAERNGMTEDASMWRSIGDALASAFMTKFYDPHTRSYTSGTQCSFVLPLAFGLTPADPAQRQAIVDNLVKDITVTHHNHLTVGLLGVQWLFQVLSDSGRPDVAWTLATQRTRPSWGYMIDYGSRSIWERWDYDTRDPGMNSEALLIQAGNVDAWFYQTLGGIQYDPAKPGFAHILIHPRMLGDLTWVKCRFDSPHGLIVSNWTRQGQYATMNVTIPANTTATVTTPDGAAHEVGSGAWVWRSSVAAGTWAKEGSAQARARY